MNGLKFRKGFNFASSGGFGGLATANAKAETLRLRQLSTSRTFLDGIAWSKCDMDQLMPKIHKYEIA